MLESSNVFSTACSKCILHCPREASGFVSRMAVLLGSVNHSLHPLICPSVCPSVNRSVDQSSQLVRQSVRQSVNHQSVSQTVTASQQSVSQSIISQPVSQSVGQSVGQSVSQSVSQWSVSQNYCCMIICNCRSKQLLMTSPPWVHVIFVHV